MLCLSAGLQKQAEDPDISSAKKTQQHSTVEKQGENFSFDP